MLATLIGVSTVLVLTNAATLYWALKYRKPLKVSKQLAALQRVIAAFEVEGQTVLHITKIHPDQVFLRNPGR